VADSPDWAFQWQRNGQNITGATTATYMVQDTGRYTVVKSFRNICSKDTSSQEVVVGPGSPPPASLTASSLYICEDEAVELAANATLPFSQAYLYRWRRDAQPNEAGTATLSATQEGLYTLTVTDDRNGCETQDTLRLRKEVVDVKLPAKLSIQKGKSVELRPVVSSLSGAHVYEWLPARGLSSASDSVVLAAPSETTTYTLRVTSANGCTVELTVEVVVFDKLYIPDAFSPNGDGINDRFEIKNAESQVQSTKIFSRWGELLFYTTDPTTFWDGIYQNALVPPGEYIYQIETEQMAYQGAVWVLY
jgi:gliding motility-associated-like protein